MMEKDELQNRHILNSYFESERLVKLSDLNESERLVKLSDLNEISITPK